MGKLLWWMFGYIYNKIFPRGAMYSTDELLVRFIVFMSLVIAAIVFGLRAYILISG